MAKPESDMTPKRGRPPIPGDKRNVTLNLFTRQLERLSKEAHVGRTSISAILRRLIDAEFPPTHEHA